MNFPGLLLLLITQYLSGRGLLHLFGLKLGRTVTALLSLMCGVAVFSLLPFILQLCNIPITFSTVLIAICVCTLLLSISRIRSKELLQFKKINWPLKPYEYPFLIVFAVLALVSVWHVFYYPPVPRDLLSGPEVVAEYTVREHSMINSIFTIDLSTTNNYLKPPFITCLQIIYKLFVSPFGQVWLSILVVPFLIWLYMLLREKLHPLVACLLMLSFFAMPELYSYTFLVLFDYSNMIFFFCGFYFLCRYAVNRRGNEFMFAALMFGIATYIRSETLVLVCMALPIPAFLFYKEKLPVTKAALRLFAFVAIPAFFYLIWINVFVKYYMPVQFNVGGQINPDLGNIKPFFDRLLDTSTNLIFSKFGVLFWGYFIFLFLLVLVADIIFFRHFNSEAVIALYGICVVYVGLSLLGYLSPWVNLWDTTKRGLFKMLPLMLLYMRNSGMLLMLSDKIRVWEMGGVVKAPVQAVKGARKVK